MPTLRSSHRTRHDTNPPPQVGYLGILLSLVASAPQALEVVSHPTRPQVYRSGQRALRRHAFAQAVTIMALEEVLDLDEHRRRGRHSDDYPSCDLRHTRCPGMGMALRRPSPLGNHHHRRRQLEPKGVPAAVLPLRARDLLSRLVDVYLDRLAPTLAEHERQQLQFDEVCFAWEGGLRAGEGPYYRLQAPGLLIEYDTPNKAPTTPIRCCADPARTSEPACLALTRSATAGRSPPTAATDPCWPAAATSPEGVAPISA